MQNLSEKICISMMSGTSLDGIDACLVKVKPDFSVEVLANYSLDYPDEIRENLLKLANGIGSVQDVCFMNFVVGEKFAECANSLIKNINFDKSKIDFISSHGQTVFHIPTELEIADCKTKSTLQIGDISVISQRTGIMTVGDFRTKDVAAGGFGAPLVPFADEISFGKKVPRGIQNIGGISNSTILSEECDTFAFDNGPGNMLIDYFVKKYFNISFDKNGEIAASGLVDKKWLNQLLEEPYYSLKPPKTTGRELFNAQYCEKILTTAPAEKADIIATLTNLTAKVIFDSYKKFVYPKTHIEEVVLGGGGAYNNTLKKFLQEYFEDVKIKTHEDFGIPNKLKEAIAFAILGYCTIFRIPNNIPSCTGAKTPVVMGKIAY